MTPDSFAAFYALYPRKVARKAAEKAWARCATSPELIEQIIAGLKAQLPRMCKKEKQFIPHPATWLNQERWQDELWMDVDDAFNKPRLIACEKCADTGVVMRVGAHLPALRPCDCRMGNLPGMLAGVQETGV